MTGRPPAHTRTDEVVRVLPMGESAVLVEPMDARIVLDLYRRLRASAPEAVTELVPAASTILVAFDPAAMTRRTVAEWVTGAVAWPVDTADDPHGSAQRPDRADQIVEIAVRYDGADLGVVAELTGASVDQVIAAHLEQLWTVAFLGFAPGFAYLAGEDDRLSVPRRATPRAAVPAGSVAVAAGYCGLYPRESPGGWHLIGHTDALLWDTGRADPALLTPGARVRFTRER